MTIKDLKQTIKDLPDDMEVILQKDAEGNGFSPLYAVDSNAVYVPSSTWHGKVYSVNWTADEAMKSDSEWEEMKKAPRALILAPVN